MREPLVPPAPALGKINVVPIIDVALVLVIILLFTAPMLSVAQVELSLPQARARGVEDASFISITLGRTGQLAVDETTVSLQELGPRLRARLAEEKDENILVVVRADEGAPYGAVREILKQVRAAGARRLAVGTRQSGRADG